MLVCWRDRGTVLPRAARERCAGTGGAESSQRRLLGLSQSVIS